MQQDEKSAGTLQALLRGGYAAHPAIEDETILLRHEGGGPDLLLRPDGALYPVSVPGGGVSRHPAMPIAGSPEQTGSWNRRLGFAIALVALWVLSLVLTVSLFGGV